MSSRKDARKDSESLSSDGEGSDSERPKSIIRKSQSRDEDRKPILVYRTAHSGSSESVQFTSAIKKEHSTDSPDELSRRNSNASDLADFHSQFTHPSTSALYVMPACPKASSSTTLHQTPRLNLIVEGSHFSISADLFRSQPNTMLARMFSPPALASGFTQPNSNGEYEIRKEGLTGTIFGVLLEYYKEGVMQCPTSLAVTELRDVCDYFLIPFNASTVRCHNIRSLLHEFSNVGAKEQFSLYLEMTLYPVLVAAAQAGERECHIVLLATDDSVDWNDDYPPPMGEEQSQVVRNMDLYRFFRYFENREVAKQVLRERGLKKIRLGVEGFPTCVDKIKRNKTRVEVVYSYIQRPFIHMSWEKEDKHVDFQCIKTNVNPAPFVVAAADIEQDHAIVAQHPDLQPLQDEHVEEMPPAEAGDQA